MFLFGRVYDGLNPQIVRRIRQEAAISAGLLLDTEVGAILHALEGVRTLWRFDGPFFARARNILALQHGCPPSLVDRALEAIPQLMSRDRLEQRLRADFSDPSILDDFLDLPHRQGRIRAFPLGGLLHELQGATCLDAVEAVVAGLLTKNVSVLQVSDRDQDFVSLFLESLQQADVSAKLARYVGCVDAERGREHIDSLLAGQIDGIVTWGNRPLSEFRDGNVHSKVKYIRVESRMSMHVISRGFWESCDRQALAETLVPERCLFEGHGPHGPQYFFFVEHGIDVRSVRKLLARRYGDLVDNGALPHYRGYGQRCDRHSDEIPKPSGPSGLQTRSLVITSYRSLDNLQRQVKSLFGHPYSCGYGLEAEEHGPYLRKLAMVGLRHFVPLERGRGGANRGFGLGSYPLREMVRFVTDEREFALEDLLIEAGAKVPFYWQRKPAGSVTDLERWPLTTGADLASEPLYRSRSSLGGSVQCGSIFSSGGTSASPKYALYAPQEFSRTAEMLARGFMASGLRRGQTAINLFVAGNLWSSFLIVDEALRKCGVYVLPMGGLSPPEEIVACLASFKPDVAFGLPSLLVDCAQYSEEHHWPVSIDTIFYAGERMSPSAYRYLQAVWKTKLFHSAGYATVDVGPIGWQCAYCEDGEHHLFSKEVHMEVVDGEAVVTSLLRRAMPVIRYRTGDAVEWLDGQCPCGSTEPKFALLGRTDGVINLWGCRLAFADVEKSLLEAGMTASIMQVRLRNEISVSGCQDELVVCMEQLDVPASFFEQFTERLLHYCKDVALMLDLATLRRRVRIECVKPNSIPRIARTGKVRLVVDDRS